MENVGNNGGGSGDDGKIGDVHFCEHDKGRRSHIGCMIPIVGVSQYDIKEEGSREERGNGFKLGLFESSLYSIQVFQLIPSRLFP